MYVLVGECLLDSRQVECRWSNYDIDLVLIELELIDDIFDEILGLLEGVVGFPIASDEQFF